MRNRRPPKPFSRLVVFQRLLSQKGWEGPWPGPLGAQQSPVDGRWGEATVQQLSSCFQWIFLFLPLPLQLISSSILGTYHTGEFIFQCPIFLPFHTVHGVLKARIWKWFAIPFSSGPRFVRSLHHDPSVLGGPVWHGL